VSLNASEPDVAGALQTEDRLRLAPSATSPRVARRFVAARLSDTPGISPDVVAAAALVASELVTNAVQHTHSPVCVCIEHHDTFVRVMVSERCRVDTAGVGVTCFPERGKAPSLVDRLSDRWGVDLRDGVRCVWSEFSLH
jgi:hypothetical protein